MLVPTSCYPRCRPTSLGWRTGRHIQTTRRTATRLMKTLTTTTATTSTSSQRRGMDGRWSTPARAGTHATVARATAKLPAQGLAHSPPLSLSQKRPPPSHQRPRRRTCLPQQLLLHKYRTRAPDGSSKRCRQCSDVTRTIQQAVLEIRTLPRVWPPTGSEAR